MCITCNKKLTINQIIQMDPTRTISTRKRFVSQVNRRFARLKREVRQHILEGSLLKREFDFLLTLKINTTAAEWRSLYDPNKIPDFMEWLEEQNNKFILSKGGEGIEVFIPPGQTTPLFPGQASAEVTVKVSGQQVENWTDVHIRSAYQKGVQRARQELRKAGVDLPSFESQPSGLSGVFNAPFHVDRVQLAFTQTFEGLKGITKAMDAPISRAMAEGMARGDSPRIIAKRIAGIQVDIGGVIKKSEIFKIQQRARTLARTEVIRAHHNASINEYEAAGITGVKVKAEWSTAGFNVCPICSANEGRIFTLNQIRGLIPVHPNCRCVAIPIVQSDKKFKRRTSKVATSIVKGDVQFENI